MISSIFNTIVYNPIYNGLIYFESIVPWSDVGIAVILVTVLVKLILFPLSKKAVRTQMVMRRLEPELSSIKEKYKNDKQQQAQKIMQFYKDNDVNPFSSIFLLFIQIPIILGLFFVFKNGLTDINGDVLYSFIHMPENVNMMFLGVVDMAGKSFVIALLAAITQYYQFKLTLPPLKARTENPTMKEDLARSMHLQMKYTMPIIMGVFGYTLGAVIALYFLTSNIFAIGQELVIKRQVKEKFHEE